MSINPPQKAFASPLFQLDGTYSARNWKPFNPIESLSAWQHSGLGYLAAFTAIVLTATYPAITRVSVTTTLTPADLLMLRMGVSGCLFAPFLFLRGNRIPMRVWVIGIPLSFLHGWGMSGCVIFGLQFAPASHSAALGPGTVSVWIALLNFLLYGVAVHRAKALAISAIICGVSMLLAASLAGLSTAKAFIGDAMFLAAPALAAGYLVYVQQNKLDPICAVALVSVYSTLVVLPWYLFVATSTLQAAPVAEVTWQVIFQGILMGCVVFPAINYATVTIGSQTFGLLFALVPVFGLLSSLMIANDPVSPVEWGAIAAISGGVAIGARSTRVRSQGQL